MKIGLIGLNQTGKTSLFDLLTGRDEHTAHSGGGKGTANVGMGIVPDARIDFLSALYNPKKTTYAKIEFTDVAGFSPSKAGHSSGAAKFLNDVRGCDALVHVLRAFESGSVIHELGSVNPARDLDSVETEMVFADLELIEKRISRIKEGKKITAEHSSEIDFLTRCSEALENNISISSLELSDDERAKIRNFGFLTVKPRMVVVNTDEKQWEAKTWPGNSELQTLCDTLKLPVIELCVATELEISRLPDEDKALFMEDMNITQSGISILASSAYSLLGLISFLTVGPDEVRAWTIERGTPARRAAGKIHTDIERGFIRAEVVNYKDIYELGSMAKVKEKGLFRLEGKEYIVADGDIINFRFNV